MCICVHAVCVNLSWYRQARAHTHTPTHTLLLHFTCLTFNFRIFLKDLCRQKHRVMIQLRTGREESGAWWQNAEWGREKHEETSNALLLSPAFSLSAGFYLLWFCCSTETWADIKSDAKKYMCTQTHRHTHLIFTSCAPLPSVDISWLPCKLKAHIADGDSYAF